MQRNAIQDNTIKDNARQHNTVQDKRTQEKVTHYFKRQHNTIQDNTNDTTKLINMKTSLTKFRKRTNRQPNRLVKSKVQIYEAPVEN